ncbi:MAG: tannase/feruloyl esterase family alpha/beta hydrolase [Gemmatimonadales bacterium]
MKPSLSVVLMGVMFAAAPLSSQQLPRLAVPPQACANLKHLQLTDVRFTEVVDVADSLPHDKDNDTARTPHCRVTGVIGKSTVFIVILPNSWNQRLLMAGNGGFAGRLNRGVSANAKDGYLTVSTNTGHEAPVGGGARWALNDPDRQRDFGYLAVHNTIVVAKALAKAFYGSEPRYSYFSGCSNGGRQGLMEAQRYPEDFDGVISGAPAAHMTRTFPSFFKNIRAAFPDPTYFDHPIVTRENLDLLAAKVLEKCDNLDGVRDGILGDPRDCQFDVGTIKACPGDRAAADCLTGAERAVIARIYSPATDDSGRVIYPGQPVGGENLRGGWGGWITGRDSALMHDLRVPSPQAMFMTEAAKYFLFNDSTWDYSRHRGSLVQEAKSMANLLDSDNPDLSRFAGRNGKLILFHGWSDPALNPLATIEYYDKVRSRDPKASEYVRLYMQPGVLHCAGGPGPDDLSWLNPLTKWRETGIAPTRLIATKRDSTGKTLISRPLCPYPEGGVYAGKGDTNNDASFVCRAR